MAVNGNGASGTRVLQNECLLIPLPTVEPTKVE